MNTEMYLIFNDDMVTSSIYYELVSILNVNGQCIIFFFLRYIIIIVKKNTWSTGETLIS